MIMSTLQAQQEQAEQSARASAPAHSFATVGAVYPNGVTLIFPGETIVSKKRYPYSAAATFKAGQRVHITKAAGTYLVMCPITGGT